MKIKLLDCTLRDGGYYNDWDFEQQAGVAGHAASIHEVASLAFEGRDVFSEVRFHFRQSFKDCHGSALPTRWIRRIPDRETALWIQHEDDSWIDGLRIIVA